MISPGCHGPAQKTQQTPGPQAAGLALGHSLQLASNHVWVSGPEHELIALGLRPPQLPAYFMVQ